MAINPSTAIVLSAFLWGTWWYPLRQLDAAGSNNVWVTGAGMALPLVFLLPLTWKNRKRIFCGGWLVVLAPLLIAASMALYAEGMIQGSVARVILLFYLTPVWSALFGYWLLNEAITLHRIMAIVLGLSGLLIIFGLDGGWPLPQQPAEWMGLASGVIWGLGLAFSRMVERHATMDKVSLYFVFIVIFFMLLTAIAGDRQWSMPVLLSYSEVVLWIGLIAFVWMVPVVWLTMVGSSGIDPGKVSILLMLEVVVAIVSAAALAGEFVSSREIIGGVLIIAAGTTEYFAGRLRS